MNILFLCVGNSARSQMAEGLAKKMFGSDHKIQSAGSKPSEEVHPVAINVMNEIGIDISEHKTKSIDDLEDTFITSLDYIVTLCAEEICPMVPSNAESINWILEDPANKNFNDIELKFAFKKTRSNLFDLLKKFMVINL